MFKGKNIAIIGGGKMGSIIAQGLIDHKIIPCKDIFITDIDAARLDYLRSSMKLKISTNNEKAAKKADIIILAVKPQNMAATLKEISSVINKSKIVISKLYVDQNRNLDLTDDPAGVFSSTNKGPNQVFTNVTVLLRTAAGLHP
ncbi:MAG: pyrroline-5-carboxylate reductase family protein, partial [Smithella sp.]